MMERISLIKPTLIKSLLNSLSFIRLFRILDSSVEEVLKFNYDNVYGLLTLQISMHMYRGRIFRRLSWDCFNGNVYGTT